MAAQTLVKASRPHEARSILETGIASAQRKGDSHAQSEMQALFEELSS